jgi:hypothetical protein
MVAAWRCGQYSVVMIVVMMPMPMVMANDADEGPRK